MTAQPASALACNVEQQKFVQLSRNSYGNMGTLQPIQSIVDPCGSRANTVFLYLGGPHLDYIEAGVRIFGGDPSHFVVFWEYCFYPCDPTNPPYGATGYWTTNQYMSLNVSNTTGAAYTWKTQYSLGTSQTGWTTHLTTTPVALENYGTPQGEVSRYGNTDANIDETRLKYRPLSGGWYDWDSLGCSTIYLNTIPDWDAIKGSNTHWWTEKQAPPPGDC